MHGHVGQTSLTADMVVFERDCTSCVGCSDACIENAFSSRRVGGRLRAAVPICLPSLHLPFVSSSTSLFFIVHPLPSIHFTNMNLVLLKSLSLFTKEETVICNLPGGYVTFHT